MKPRISRPLGVPRDPRLPLQKLAQDMVETHPSVKYQLQFFRGCPIDYFVRAIAFWTTSFAPLSQLSQHRLKTTVSRPRSPSGLPFGKSRPFPVFPLRSPSRKTTCQRSSPSLWNPILSATRREAAFIEFAFHCTLRKPIPPSAGSLSACSSISPTALVVTWVRWYSGRITMQPISVDKCRAEVSMKAIMPANSPSWSADEGALVLSMTASVSHSGFCPETPCRNPFTNSSLVSKGPVGIWAYKSGRAAVWEK